MSLICLCALVHASCVMGVKSVINSHCVYAQRGIRPPAAAAARCALVRPRSPLPPVSACPADRDAGRGTRGRVQRETRESPDRERELGPRKLKFTPG